MNLVEVKNNQIVVTSSLKVAETFGKQHKDVLKSIVNLVAQNFATKNYFFESTHENRGKQYKMYYMNRDGFSLLVMGFTGKKAIEWKIKFINAFNEMEEALKHPKPTVPVPQFRRVTWRGEVVMISTHLASIMGLCPSTIKRTVVLNDVYRIIVTGDALKSFKRENHMLHYTAKSFTLYPRNSVNTLLTLYGMHDKLDVVINDYFPTIKEPPVRKIKLDSESIYRDIDIISKQLITINGLLNHLPVNSRTDARQCNIMQTVEEMWIETGSYITGLHRRIETL